MPATQESAVMDKTVTGAATATMRKPAKKKAKVDTGAIRAQIKEERGTMADTKRELKFAKDALRTTLKEGRATVLAATKALKAATVAHVKEVKRDEKEMATCDKAVVKQQGVIDKLMAKLG